MKKYFSKTVLSILFTLILILLTFFSQSKLEAYQYVRVEGRQLVTDFDENGTYRPFFIQGAGYLPDPIGRHSSDWGYPHSEDPRPDNIFDDPEILERDFTLLQNMNANAIRIWSGSDGQTGARFPNKLTQQTFDYAEQHNIKIIAGFWLPYEGWWGCDTQSCTFNRNIDYEDQDTRNELLSKFGAYVSKFKDHPGLLFWALGNENNYHFGDDQQKIAAFFSLVNEMAELAHQIEGDDFHPVAYVNGDLNDINNPDLGTTDAQMNHLDIWGANVYRGDSFGALFTDYANFSSKPFWVAEYGIDAFHTTDYNNPSQGYEDQTAQATYAGKLWDEIMANDNVAIGGTIMAYSDQYWKPDEWLCVELGQDCDILNSTQNYFGFGPADFSQPPDGIIDWYPPSPDNFFHEEWWGIMAISEHPTDPYGPNIMTPREVYTTLQNKFVPIIPPVLDPIGDKTAMIGQSVQFTVSASDPQDEAITLTAKLASGDPLSSISATFTDHGDGTGTFQWNTVGAHGDIIPVVFKAFDPNDLIDVETICIELAQHKMLNPVPGDTLTSPTVTFSWEGSPNVSNYWLGIGTSPAALKTGGDIYYESVGAKTSVVVPGVLLTGSPVYVRLWSIAGSSWKYSDYMYQTIDLGGYPGTMASPTPNSMLTTETVTFQWDAGSGVTEYRLGVGTSQSILETSGDIYDQSLGTATSASVPGIDMNGDPIYVRLWSKISGEWFFVNYAYQTEDQTPVVFQVDSPTPSSTITESNVRFRWSGSGISQFRFQVGTTSGGQELYNGYFYSWSSKSARVNGIPLNGDTIYVRLSALTLSGWQYNDYTYSTSVAQSAADMLNPSPNSTLTTPSVLFNWTTGNGVSEYRLGVGTSQSSIATGGNIYYQSLGTSTSVNVSGIPLTGQQIYVRLWSRIGTEWVFNDYSYFTENQLAEPAITIPSPGSTLTNSTVTFQWDAGDGVTNYWLGVGTSLNAVKRGGDIYYSSEGLNTSRTVSGIPLTGQTIYVRLWWSGPGIWRYADYTFETQ